MVSIIAKAEGDIAAILRDARDQTAAALREGVTLTAERVQADLRSQVRAAGLGRKLEKAWQDRVYPKEASNKTFRPAGLVYSKSVVLHDTFMYGATITARRGRYLAIPTREAEAMGLATTTTSRSGGAIPGGQLRRAARIRGIALLLGAENLRDIPLPQGRRLIVYRPPAGRGKRETLRSKGRAVAFERGRDVPLFLLVPQVRLAPRLDFDAAAAAGESTFVRAVDTSLDAVRD